MTPQPNLYIVLCEVEIGTLFIHSIRPFLSKLLYVNEVPTCQHSRVRVLERGSTPRDRLSRQSSDTLLDERMKLEVLEYMPLLTGSDHNLSASVQTWIAMNRRNGKDMINGYDLCGLSKTRSRTRSGTRVVMFGLPSEYGYWQST